MNGKECPICLAVNDSLARFCQFCGADLTGSVIQGAEAPRSREIRPYKTQNYTGESHQEDQESYGSVPLSQIQQSPPSLYRRSFFHDFFLFMLLWQVFKWIGLLIAMMLGMRPRNDL